MGILNARMQQILQLLLSTDELQTSGEIATNLQLSSKTVQKEMKELNKLLSDKTAIIDSYRGKGYLLRIFDEEQFKHFLRKDTDKNDQVIPTEPEARMQFLMEKLLLQTSYLKIDDLADELFVSRSTLQSDINDVRNIVKKYHLSLEQKPNYGIKITGNEMDIRFCISEYVFNH
ncbi:MAG: helix-turn-helix domain-containing protein, partial [Tetragenococcus halophilus]|nr:helix-turn-helix domain-containing protein [Tetragenococcus halophilus]